MTTFGRAAARKSNFFGTLNDLGPGVCKFEGEHRAKYVREGYYDAPETPEYASAMDIPALGTSPSYLYHNCPKYLVLPVDMQVTVTVIQLNAGGVRYEVEGKKNQSAFMVHFGGIFEGFKLIGGSFFFNSEGPDVRALCLRYAECITEGFTQVRDPSHIAWQVGPEALEMLRSGVPLQTTFTDREILSPDAIPKRKRR